MNPSISAIVCTYNRRDLVGDVLETLVHQDLPRSEYEIIVVDNNSTDGTFDFLAERYAAVPNLKLVREPMQGLAVARNTGVSVAGGAYVAFTDDDALVPPDWLRRFVAHFEALDPRTAIIGGGIEPIFEGERPEWLVDELLQPLSAGLLWKDGPRHLSPAEWVCEVNSAYRVAPLVKYGGFPAFLGRVGENLMSGENAVNEVLRHEGYLVYYDPHIVVQHRVPASRLTRRWFRRRAFWQGVSRVVLRNYLEGRGIEGERLRALGVPCEPQAWVHLFDEELAGDELLNALYSVEDVGFLLASQSLIGAR